MDYDEEKKKRRIIYNYFEKNDIIFIQYFSDYKKGRWIDLERYKDI